MEHLGTSQDINCSYGKCICILKQSIHTPILVTTVTYSKYCLSGIYMICFSLEVKHQSINQRGSHGRHRMVVSFTTTCAISAYHH
jgi:hypothetical protein